MIYRNRFTHQMARYKPQDRSMPSRRGVQAQNRPRGTVQALLARAKVEMRHTGGMKRQSIIPDSQRLGCMPWAGANGFFAQPRRAQMKLGLMAAIVIPLLFAGCDTAESVRIDETRAKFIGTWQRGVELDSGKGRRVLTLGKDGKFMDRSDRVGSDGSLERQEYAGEWSYDGTYLKRRFLQENGRQFSGGKIRYATFQLKAVSASEFVVNDSIEGRDVTYRRVSEGMKF